MPTDAEAAAEVLKADDRRFEAMRKGDWAGLDATLADDLTYVHSTARLESKAEHVANLRAGKPHYRGSCPASAGPACTGASGWSTECPRCTWRTRARSSTSPCATSRCTRKAASSGA